MIYTVTFNPALDYVIDVEKLNLAIKVLDDKDVMYCPHGRPVSVTYTKNQLDKQFDRIV